MNTKHHQRLRLDESESDNSSQDTISIVFYVDSSIRPPVTFITLAQTSQFLRALYNLEYSTEEIPSWKSFLGSRTYRCFGHAQ